MGDPAEDEFLSKLPVETREAARRISEVLDVLEEFAGARRASCADLSYFKRKAMVARVRLQAAHDQMKAAEADS